MWFHFSPLDVSRPVVHCVVLQSVPCALEEKPCVLLLSGEYFVSVSSGWFGCVCLAGVSVTHPGRRVHLQQGFCLFNLLVVSDFALCIFSLLLHLYVFRIFLSFCGRAMSLYHR